MNDFYYNYGYGCCGSKSNRCCPNMVPTRNNLEAVSLNGNVVAPNMPIAFKKTPVHNGEAISHNMSESVINLNRCGVYLVIFTTSVKLPCFPPPPCLGTNGVVTSNIGVGQLHPPPPPPPPMCVNAAVNIWVNSYPLEYTTVSQTIIGDEIANLTTQAIIQVPRCGVDITVRNATTDSDHQGPLLNGSKHDEISLVFENPNISVIKLA